MARMRRILPAFVLLSFVAVACANSTDVEETPDTGTLDSGVKDATVKDSSTKDAGKDVEVVKDSSVVDSTVADANDGSADAEAGADVVVADATLDVSLVDAGPDVSVVDASPDVSVIDASPDVSVVDGGTTNDTCQLATVVQSGVMVSGDTTNANNDYDVNANISLVCDLTDLSFYTFDGNDVAYTISVPSGKTLTATVTPTTAWDPAIAIVSDCGNAGPTCLGGDDFNGVSSPETGTYTNSSGQTKTVFILVDSYSTSEYGPFTLTATVQ